MTFLATCGCAIDFLKTLPKFKMAARSQLQIFLWAQKLYNFKSEIIQIFYHIPHHMEMCRWLFQGFTEIQNGRHR